MADGALGEMQFLGRLGKTAEAGNRFKRRYGSQ
jgi:hypothetical protein